MADSLSSWLNDLPARNGGVNIFNQFQGAVIIDSQSINNLAVHLATDTFLTNWKLLFSDPSTALSSLRAYPFKIPCITSSSVYKLAIFGTEYSDVKCLVPDFVAPNANYLIDMGSVYIKPSFNNFADYNGYTDISVYLPFYGLAGLIANDIMGKYLYFKLFIDYRTGKGVYYICVNNNANADSADLRILAKYEVTLGYNIPLGSSNANEIMKNMLLGSLKTAAYATAIYGFSKGMAPSGSTSKETTITKKLDKKTGVLHTTGSKTIEKSNKLNIGGTTIAASSVAAGLSSLENATTRMSTDKIDNTLLDMASTKHVKVIIKRPKLVNITSDYNKLYGKPAGYTATLSTLEGFTKVSSVQLEGFNSALQSEVSEIGDILLNGVIL